MLTTCRLFCYRKRIVNYGKGTVSLVHSPDLPLSQGCHIKNSFQMVHKKWTNILFCRTWAASSSYTWSPFTKKPSLLRMRWGNIWKMVLVILLWVKPLALGFFTAESRTKKANNKDVNRNDTSWCPSLWCVHHFLFLKVNCSSELTAEKPSHFAWIFNKNVWKKFVWKVLTKTFLAFAISLCVVSP